MFGFDSTQFLICEEILSMTLPSTLSKIRRIKGLILEVEDDLEAMMKAHGIPTKEEPKKPGRPIGSKNRPKVSPQPPEAMVG